MYHKLIIIIMLCLTGCYSHGQNKNSPVEEFLILPVVSDIKIHDCNQLSDEILTILHSFGNSCGYTEINKLIPDSSINQLIEHFTNNRGETDFETELAIKGTTTYWWQPYPKVKVHAEIEDIYFNHAINPRFFKTNGVPYRLYSGFITFKITLKAPQKDNNKELQIVYRIKTPGNYSTIMDLKKAYYSNNLP